MAVTLTAQEFATRLGPTNRDVDAFDVATETAAAAAVLDTATEVVTQHAPSAPDVIHNEAAIRVAAYLLARERRRDQGSRTISGGDAVATERLHVGHSALRGSGAMALLAPYRIRRAGRCEEATA